MLNLREKGRQFIWPKNKPERLYMILRVRSAREKWRVGNGKTCGRGGGTESSYCFALIFGYFLSRKSNNTTLK
jgi:hypothetical protein